MVLIEPCLVVPNRRSTQSLGLENKAWLLTCLLPKLVLGGTEKSQCYGSNDRFDF